MRLARALDCGADDEREAAYARVMIPAAKFLICKLAPGFVYEAMECLGGNGYVEESLLPRLYREAPVNSIWEGSGNVMCLDVLRALKQDNEAEVVAALLREVGASGGPSGNTAAASEASARARVGRLALAAAAAALKMSAPAAVADWFVRTRLQQPHGGTYGTADIDAAAAKMLLERAARFS